MAPIHTQILALQARDEIWTCNNSQCGVISVVQRYCLAGRVFSTISTSSVIKKIHKSDSTCSS